MNEVTEQDRTSPPFVSTPNLHDRTPGKRPHRRLFVAAVFTVDMREDGAYYLVGCLGGRCLHRVAAESVQSVPFAVITYV